MNCLKCHFFSGHDVDCVEGMAIEVESLRARAEAIQAQLVDACEKARLEEREACAKECEAEAFEYMPQFDLAREAATECANRIRARSGR